MKKTGMILLVKMLILPLKLPDAFMTRRMSTLGRFTELRMPWLRMKTDRRNSIIIMVKMRLESLNLRGATKMSTLVKIYLWVTSERQCVRSSITFVIECGWAYPHLRPKAIQKQRSSDPVG